MFLQICPVYSQKNQWSFSSSFFLFSHPDAKRRCGSLHSSAARRPIFTAIQCGTQPTLAGTKNTILSTSRWDEAAAAKVSVAIALAMAMPKICATNNERERERWNGRQTEIKRRPTVRILGAVSVSSLDLHTYMDYVRQRKTLSF